MEQAIKVSVIMLAYNIGRYIETAIKGVIRQKTDYPIQLVISEDCSTDDTLEICERYKAQYPELITLVRHEKNVGLQRNFMDAHKHCQGEYIAICDGDDYWIDRNKLQRMTDFMDSHPDFAICFHRVINYYEENHSKSLSNGKQAEITDLLDLCSSNFITNSSSLFRRSYYPVVPEWFSEITSCDYAMHLLNAGHGKVYYFKKPMAVYRKHKQGIWSEAAEEKRLLAALKAREKVLAYYQNNPQIYEALKKNYTLIAFNLLRHYRTTGKEQEAANMRKELLTYHPEWTDTMVQEKVETDLRNKKRIREERLKAILSWGRAQLSKLIPVPTVR